jgi:peptide-methionine (R)-S-oxide reductase
LRDGTQLSCADPPVVYTCYCRDLNPCAAEERFFRQVKLGPVDRAFDYFHPDIVAQQHHDRSPCDAFKNILCHGRGAHNALADQEKIFCGSLGNMAVLVEHNGFIEPGPLSIGFDKSRIYIGAGDLPAGGNHIVIDALPGRDRDMAALFVLNIRAKWDRNYSDFRVKSVQPDTDDFVAIVGNRSDIAVCPVCLGFEKIYGELREIRFGVRQLHQQQPGGFQETSIVIVGSEDEQLLLVAVPISAKAAKDAGAVVKSMSQDTDFGIRIRNDTAFKESKIGQGHSKVLLAQPSYSIAETCISYLTHRSFSMPSTDFIFFPFCFENKNATDSTDFTDSFDHRNRRDPKGVELKFLTQGCLRQPAGEYDSIECRYVNSKKREAVTKKIIRPESEWKRVLTPEQYRIMREKGTERAFTGQYWDNHDKGIYHCACCGNELFSSDAKFDSGTGWPSFFTTVSDANVKFEDDASHFMKRVEVLCHSCDAHLGHLFDDGPDPTGMRFCVNSASLKFKKSE